MDSDKVPSEEHNTNEMDSDKVPSEEHNTNEMDLDKVPSEEHNTNEVHSWLREDNGTDDEETIAEEEALEEEMSPDEELTILSQDMNMSLEELLSQTRQTRRTRGKRSETAEITPQFTSIESAFNDLQEWQHSELAKFYITKVARKEEHTETDDDDDEYVPLGAVRRDVRVGKEYQADMDESLTSIDSSDDILMWKPPTDLSNDVVQEYLKSANKIMTLSKPKNDESHVSTYVPDNVLALEILTRCKYEVSESLNQLKAYITELEAKEKCDVIPCKTSDDEMAGGDNKQTKETK